MNTLLQDLRYAVRQFFKNPGFTVVAVLALALGIGATTTIFSVVNTVLLRPLPFAQPETLATIWELRDNEQSVASYPNFADWREQARSFEHIAAYTASSAVVTGGDEAEKIEGLVVSADLFPLLRVQPAVGRVFTSKDDQPGRDRVVVLSQGFWQRRYGGSRDIIGREILISGRKYTVLGVMPAGFRFPIRTTRVDYYTPLVPGIGDNTKQRGAHFLSVVGRLRPGVSIREANAELATLATRLAGAYPRTNAGYSASVLSLHENLVGKTRPALFVLLAAVGAVLLIACANVANLLLARAASRRKEIALRAALGASRARIIRQLLTESALLGLFGGLLGLLLASWGVDVLVATSPVELPRLPEVGIDKWVLAFTTGVALLTGIVFGLAPALQASRLDLNASLGESGRGEGGESGRGRRLRASLVVAEVALSLVLLVGAGLLIKSFVRLRQVDPGIDPRGVVCAEVVLPGARYPEPAKQQAFFTELIRRVQALPGVAGAGIVNPVPMGKDQTSYTFTIVGQPPPAPGQDLGADWCVTSPDYFRSLGIRLLAGRTFTDRDIADAPPVVMVNQAFARRYFPNGDALGQRIRISNEGDDGSGSDPGAPPEPPAPQREIIGIIGDIRHLGLGTEPGPEFYVPYLQHSTRFCNLTVRAASPGANLAPLISAVRRIVHEMDGDLSTSDIGPMERLVVDSIAVQRFHSTLLLTFAGVALVLAAVGVYGVMSYTVSRRTQEIGIRLALGAGRANVLALVVGQGLRLTLLGVGIGLLAAFALTRLLNSLLFGVSASDPLTFFAVSAFLAVTAAVASYLPARRASRIDPMVALREG